MPNHLYTTNAQQDVLVNEGYIFEGVACYVFQIEKFIDLEPRVVLNHWRSPVGDNFYTVDPAGELAPQNGYVHKAPACYVYADPQPNTVPFFRWVHPLRGDHFYALAAEPELVAEEYRLEAIACYVFADQQPGTVPFFRWYDPHVII